MDLDDKRCIFCGELHIDGIRICGKLICSSCEKMLVNTEVNEPVYENYKEIITAIMVDENGHSV